MVKLQNEYIDCKAVHHRVEHLIRDANNKAQQEQILEELTYVLSKTSKIPA